MFSELYPKEYLALNNATAIYLHECAHYLMREGNIRSIVPSHGWQFFVVDLVLHLRAKKLLEHRFYGAYCDLLDMVDFFRHLGIYDIQDMRRHTDTDLSELGKWIASAMPLAVELADSDLSLPAIVRRVKRRYSALLAFRARREVKRLARIFKECAMILFISGGMAAIWIQLSFDAVLISDSTHPHPASQNYDYSGRQGCRPESSGTSCGPELRR